MTAETAVTAPEISDADARRGFLFALSCYLLWGGLPFYMKAVAHIPSAEVVAHRIVWSVPIAGVLLLLMGRTADIRKALRTPRTLAMGALTATLITDQLGHLCLGDRRRSRAGDGARLLHQPAVQRPPRSSGSWRKAQPRADRRDPACRRLRSRC